MTPVPCAEPCHQCGAEGSSLLCPACSAVALCPAAGCRSSHAGECGWLQADLREGAVLRAELPFPWAAAPCEALTQHRLHHLAVWRAECGCGGGEAGLESELGELRSEAPVPTSWAAAYEARGLPLSHPAALLLDAPLTLLAALQAVAWPAAGSGPVTVHLLGPRRELRLAPAFAVAAALLPPGTSLELHLVGPEVPSSTACWREPRLRCSFRRSLYDAEASRALPPPALIFAPNAGVAAYPDEWALTAAAVLATGAVLAVSDYSAEALRLAVAHLEACGLCVTQRASPNPFRHPVACHARLPAWGNGFVALLRAP